MRKERRRPGPILAALLLAAALGSVTPAARSACAAPTLTVLDEGPYSPGETITVRGRYWTPDCNDVIVCTTGTCGRETCEGGEPARPARDIVLTLEGADGEVVLAGGIEGPGFTVEVTLPDVPDGTYRIAGDSRGTGTYTTGRFHILEPLP